jgi:hypothetical protein
LLRVINPYICHILQQFTEILSYFWSVAIDLQLDTNKLALGFLGIEFPVLPVATPRRITQKHNQRIVTLPPEPFDPDLYLGGNLDA